MVLDRRDLQIFPSADNNKTIRIRSAWERYRGWTLCTLGLILHVANKRNRRAEVTGQGDNQNVKVWIPLPDALTTENEGDMDVIYPLYLREGVGLPVVHLFYATEKAWTNPRGCEWHCARSDT